MLTGVPSHFIIAKLKSLIKASPNLKDVFSRKHLELEETPLIGHKEQNQMLVQMLWYVVLKMSQSIIKLFHYIHFPTTIPCLSPNPPPRPRPCLSCASTAALASRSRWTTPTWPLKAAKCSGVEPHKPRPKAKPQTGEKSEKFWVPQKSKFWKVWSLKLPVNLRDIVVLKSSSWLKRMLLSVQYPLVFHWRHISHVASQGDFYKSNILQL